jgi:hypothetical protein
VLGDCGLDSKVTDECRDVCSSWVVTEDMVCTVLDAIQGPIRSNGLNDSHPREVYEETQLMNYSTILSDSNQKALREQMIASEFNLFTLFDRIGCCVANAVCCRSEHVSFSHESCVEERGKWLNT